MKKTRLKLTAIMLTICMFSAVACKKLPGDVLGEDTGKKTQETEKKYILFPEDYYEEITGIFARSDLVVKYDFSYFDHGAGCYGMGSMTPADEEPDSDSAALVLYIEYESGKTISIDTKKASEIEGMRTLLAELLAYHGSLF